MTSIRSRLSNLNKFPLSILIVVSYILCLLGMSGCCALGLYPSNPPSARAPDKFPDTEIIFDAGDGRIGFVNADGSGLTYIVLRVNSEDPYIYGTLPVMADDNNALIFVLTPTSPYQDIVAEGILVIALRGELPIVCENWFSEKPQLIGDGILVFRRGAQMLEMYDLNDCANNRNIAPVEVYDVPVWQNVTDPVLVNRAPSLGIISPNGQYVAYRSLVNEIVIRDLESGDETRIAQGDYPAWSRDSQWLAYVEDDGIYIVAVDGTGRRRIVQSEHHGITTRTTIGGAFTPPWPSWSPDGTWLVYHLCSNAPYCDRDEIGIYSVNIETGEETRILVHGFFPHWRWPAQP